MKLAKLLHNPSAGDEDHSKEKLISLIQSNGFECSYSTTKEKGWTEIGDNNDFIIIAGGDGTIRKVIKKLINKKLSDKQFPIALLPMGTANNIASTLGFTGSEQSIIELWNKQKIKKIDIGRIFGVEEVFFLEGVGFGVFPWLMKEMKKKNTKNDAPEEELKKALMLLTEIVDSYSAKTCQLLIDGVDYSGKFLMVEVLNIRSIGPNLNLAPLADPGDGVFEVVLISEDEREELKQYVLRRLKNNEEPFIKESIKAKNIEIKWDGKHSHVDDKLVEIDKKEIKVELQKGAFDFFVNE